MNIRYLVVIATLLIQSCGGSSEVTPINVDLSSKTLEERMMLYANVDSAEGYREPPDIEIRAIELGFQLTEHNELPQPFNLSCSYRVYTDQGAFIDYVDEKQIMYFDDGPPLSGGFDVTGGSGGSVEYYGLLIQLLDDEGEQFGAQIDVRTHIDTYGRTLVVGGSDFLGTDATIERIVQFKGC